MPAETFVLVSGGNETSADEEVPTTQADEAYLCGGFSSFARILEQRWRIRSPPAFFFSLLVEISSRTLIPHFISGSVHSGSAS